MTAGQRLWLLLLSLLLGACNIVISETPVFSEADRSALVPEDGLWIADDAECQFDPDKPESEWPECATWLVVRGSGGEFLLKDGKGQFERIGALLASGEPTIVQAQWADETKSPAKTYYAFYALEPNDADPKGCFKEAAVWAVECGIQTGKSDIRPFPGITPECRPSSKEAIRSAAMASRRPNQIKKFRWLRSEPQ